MDQTSKEAIKRDLERGAEYQDFLTDELARYGIPISMYTSYERQKRGENKFGMEIKFDDKMKYTGNLYIEIGHNPQLKNNGFKPSGLFKQDNTWLWLVGDYKEAFIFGKKTLQKIYKQIFDKKVKTPDGITLKNTSSGSAQGMLVPRSAALKWCEKHIIFDEK